MAPVTRGWTWKCRFHPVGKRLAWDAGHDRFPGATISGLQTHSVVGPLPEMALRPSRRSLEPTGDHLLLLPGAVMLPGLGPLVARRGDHHHALIPKLLHAFHKPYMILFGIAGGANGNVYHPNSVLLPVLPDPADGTQHVLLASVSVAVQHLQGNDPASRCRSPVFSHGRSAIPCRQACHMSAVPVVVIRTSFKRKKIIKRPDPCLQNLYAHKSRYPGCKRRLLFPYKRIFPSFPPIKESL